MKVGTPSARFGRIPDSAFGGSAASIFWRRSLFRNSGVAHAFENRLELGEIPRVVAHRRPGSVEAGDGEGGVESETGLGCGTSLIKASKLREAGTQHKIYIRKISVGINRPPIPRDCLLPTAEVEVREARPAHPNVSIRIARTEAQSLRNVSLCFFGATDENRTESNICMGFRKISIKLKRVFTFGDAFCGALGPYVDQS